MTATEVLLPNVQDLHANNESMHLTLAEITRELYQTGTTGDSTAESLAALTTLFDTTVANLQAQIDAIEAAYRNPYVATVATPGTSNTITHNLNLTNPQVTYHFDGAAPGTPPSCHVVDENEIVVSFSSAPGVALTVIITKPIAET